MKNKEVVEAFLSGDVAVGSNLYSTGDKLFSYITCIAEWYDGHLLVNITGYSNTTSKHQSYLKHINNTKKVDNIPRNSSELYSFLNQHYTMNAADLTAIEHEGKLCRSLKDTQILGYAVIFNGKVLVDDRGNSVWKSEWIARDVFEKIFIPKVHAHVREKLEKLGVRNYEWHPTYIKCWERFNSYCTENGIVKIIEIKGEY